MHRYRICSRSHEHHVFCTKIRCTGIAFADFGLKSDAQASHLLICASQLFDFSLLGVFGTILGAFWVPLGSLWGHFGSLLGHFGGPWAPLGTTLEHFGITWEEFGSLFGVH